MAGGGRGTHEFVMTAGERGGSVTQAWSVDVSSASGVTKNNKASMGSVWLIVCESRLILEPSYNTTANYTANISNHFDASVLLELSGISIGNMGYSHTVRAGASGCEATNWVSFTSLTCKPGLGIQRTNGLTLTIWERCGSLSGAWSTDVNMLDMARNRSASQNGARLTQLNMLLRTANFSDMVGNRQVIISLGVRLGVSSCEYTQWTGATALVCSSSAGTRQTHPLSLTAGSGVSSLSQILSYDHLSISSITTTNIAVDKSSRGFPMIVSMVWLGHVDYTVAARLEASACESTRWLSTHQLTCLVPSGTQIGCSLIVSIAQMTSTLTQAFSYLSPEARGVSPSNIARGLSYLEFSGYNFFGYECSPATKVGKTSAEISFWTSQSAVQAKVGAGTHSNLAMAVTILRLVSSRAGVMSYNLPSIYGSDTSLGNVAVASNTHGLLRIFTAGAAMGTADASSRQRHGSTACEMTAWSSDSSIFARASTGMGGSLLVVLSAGVFRFTTHSGLLSYDILAPIGASGSKSRNMLPFSDSLRFVLVFHVAILGIATVGSRVGGSSCEASIWLADTALLCKLACGATASAVVLSMASQAASVTELISFDKAIILRSSPNAPVAAVKGITIIGSNYYSGHVSASARIQESACLSSVWVSDSLLACKLPMVSFSGQAGLCVSLGAMSVLNVATLSQVFTFDAPVLNPFVSNSPQSGHVRISMIGINFGAYDMSSVAKVGGSICYETLWQSDTLIVCTVPKTGATPGGAGVEIASKDLVLTLPSHELVLTNAVSFDPMSAMLPTSGFMFVCCRMVLSLSAAVETEEVLDAVLEMLVSTPSGVGFNTPRAWIFTELSTTSTRRKDPVITLLSSRRQDPSMALDMNHESTTIARRKSGATLIDVRILQDRDDARNLATGLIKRIQDGSMLNFLKAKIQVDSLVLSEDIFLVDELGNLVRCCCDPALCACYVCLEDAPTVRPFSFVTGGISLGLLLFAGCCIKSWRSKRHGDKSSFAQVMPSDSQAIANLRMRTEARLHARQAWQE